MKYKNMTKNEILQSLNMTEEDINKEIEKGQEKEFDISKFDCIIYLSYHLN